MVGIFCVLLLAHNIYPQITLTGVVKDNGFEPVKNTLVEIIDQADAAHAFSDLTDEQGRYEIKIFPTGVDNFLLNQPEQFDLLQNYPNPFNPSTVIAYQLSRDAYVRMDIYNVLGSRIKTLVDGFQPHGQSRVVWDATDDLGQGVPAGVYFYSLEADGIRLSRKMILTDGHQGNSNMNPSNTMGGAYGRRGIYKQMADQFLLRVTGENVETYVQENFSITADMVLDVIVNRTVTDIDGNIYKTVYIGDQWWMAQNLKVLHYRNGDPIPNVSDTSDWVALTTDAYCELDNNLENAAIYGRFYNWYAVADTRNIAPTGWHVPTDAEWQTLVDWLGGTGVAGGKLKAIGTLEDGTGLWHSPNTGADNETGFTALPGGCRYMDGLFYYFGNSAIFWTATEDNSNTAWYWGLPYSGANVNRRNLPSKADGMSVRCVRD